MNCVLRDRYYAEHFTVLGHCDWLSGSSEALLYQFQNSPRDKTPSRYSQHSGASNATEQQEEMDGTEEEIDSVNSDAEPDYNFSVNITPRYKTNQNRQGRRVVSYFPFFVF